MKYPAHFCPYSGRHVHGLARDCWYCDAKWKTTPFKWRAS
jgi:hypothetical protein